MRNLIQVEDIKHEELVEFSKLLTAIKADEQKIKDVMLEYVERQLSEGKNKVNRITYGHIALLKGGFEHLDKALEATDKLIKGEDITRKEEISFIVTFRDLVNESIDSYNKCPGVIKGREYVRPFGYSQGIKDEYIDYMNENNWSVEALRKSELYIWLKEGFTSDELQLIGKLKEIASKAEPTDEEREFVRHINYIAELKDEGSFENARIKELKNEMNVHSDKYLKLVETLIQDVKTAKAYMLERMERLIAENDDKYKVVFFETIDLKISEAQLVSIANTIKDKVPYKDFINNRYLSHYLSKLKDLRLTYNYEKFSDEEKFYYIAYGFSKNFANQKEIDKHIAYMRENNWSLEAFRNSEVYKWLSK